MNAYSLENKSSARVIIIGAGLAGLVAGFEMMKHGIPFRILEARMRPGGRVETLRHPFGAAFPVEAGPLSFSEEHKVVHGYIRYFGLPIGNIEEQDLTPTYSVNGRKFAPDVYGRAPWPFPMTREERDLGVYRLLNKYLLRESELFGDLHKLNALNSHAAQVDTLSCSQYLRTQGASEGAIELLRPLVSWPGDISEISALSVVRDLLVGFRGRTWSYLKGGNDSLPEAFARHLQKEIVFGAQVTNLTQSQDKVGVTFEIGGVCESIKADFAICTMPFSVLRKISIPLLSEAKRQLIDKVSYTSVTRTYLKASTRFWRESRSNGWIYSDTPTMNFKDGTYGSSGSKGVLQSYTIGTHAQALSRLTPKQAVDLVVKDLDLVFPGGGEQIESGYVKSWDNDEFSRGAYACFAPGEISSFAHDLVTPEGRIYFAGEHTSSSPGWMEGALESGQRAFEEIAQRL